MAFSLIKHLPLSVLHGLAAVGAYIAKNFNLSIYRSINANLILLNPNLPDVERHQKAEQILKNQLISTVDSLKSWAMPPKWSIEQIKTIHNLPILQAGLAHPNGLLLIVPHLGVWEMMNPWINTLGSPTIMYKPINHQALNQFVLESRQKTNATLVPTDASGVKAVFKTLKAGGFSVILPDHVPDPSGGVVVPFFGIETLSSTLASKLAQKTNCALVGLSCIRQNDGSYEVFCYDLSDSDLYHQDINIATTALNRAIEQIILPHFEHYMWGYRRFKHTPLALNPYLLPPKDLADLATQLHHHRKAS